MNPQELFRMAQRDQRHTALEEAVSPLDILPGDLLASLVDSKPETHFAIHGFVMRRRQDGSAVWVAVVSGNAVIAESWFRDHGFSDAFAGAPAFVRVRTATHEEESVYRAA